MSCYVQQVLKLNIMTNLIHLFFILAMRKRAKMQFYVPFMCIIGLLSACQPTQSENLEQVQEKEHTEAQTTVIQQSSKQALKQQFMRWKAKQDATVLQAYRQHVASYMRHPPTEFELMTNQNYMPKQCEWTRFAVPPQKYWQNIIQSLQLVEKLQLNGFFQDYEVTSSFRNAEMNACVRGATKSKHLYNYAVDFQIQDVNLKSSEQRAKLQNNLCDFWKKEGMRYRMGLGVYHDNRFHIDVQGYRTWGSDYSQKTSPCLNI